MSKWGIANTFIYLNDSLLKIYHSPFDLPIHTACVDPVEGGGEAEDSDTHRDAWHKVAERGSAGPAQVNFWNVEAHRAVEQTLSWKIPLRVNVKVG